MKLAIILWIPQFDLVLKTIFQWGKHLDKSSKSNTYFISSTLYLLFKTCLHRELQKKVPFSPGTTESVLVYWVAEMWIDPVSKNDELQIDNI